MSLVEQLREYANDPVYAPNELINEAADRIEELETKVEAYRENKAGQYLKRIEEMEKIEAAQIARIVELEVGMAFIIDAIEAGDDIEFIPEKKS